MGMSMVPLWEMARWNRPSPSPESYFFGIISLIVIIFLKNNYSFCHHSVLTFRRENMSVDADGSSGKTRDGDSTRVTTKPGQSVVVFIRSYVD